MTKQEKIEQRLEWIEFRLRNMGWESDEIEDELQLIREKKYTELNGGTKALLDFETFKVLR